MNAPLWRGLGVTNPRKVSKYKAFINTLGWHILCSLKCTK
jgi:hypothetical protein